jgi:hypothetical protein
MKVEACEVEEVVLAEEVDRVGGEEVPGQGGAVDLKRDVGFARVREGDRPSPGSPDCGQLTSSLLNRRAT